MWQIFNQIRRIHYADQRSLFLLLLLLLDYNLEWECPVFNVYDCSAAIVQDSESVLFLQCLVIDDTGIFEASLFIAWFFILCCLWTPFLGRPPPAFPCSPRSAGWLLLPSSSRGPKPTLGDLPGGDWGAVRQQVCSCKSVLTIVRAAV